MIDLVRRLKTTLSIVRRYVEWYEPKDYSEAHDRDLLLSDIESLTGAKSETPSGAYLMRRSGGGKAHHWTGSDTACRMASTGGLAMREYVVADHPEGRPICQMCAHVRQSTSVKEDPLRSMPHY